VGAERRDGARRPVRLVFGDTELSQAYLGLVVGRQPALVDRVIDDPSVSRRHMRIGMADGRPQVEDLNSPNGNRSALYDRSRVLAWSALSGVSPASSTERPKDADEYRSEDSDNQR
jgi:hypothetical protein